MPKVASARSQASARDAEANRRTALIEENKAANQAAGRSGTVACTKIRGFGAVEHLDGFLTVLPNYRHGNSKQGLGLSKLSPMSLGPVPSLCPSMQPDALCVENFYQFSKAWAHELDAAGNLTPEAWKVRRCGFQDPVPHRHKYKAEQLRALCGVKSRAPKPPPEYSIYLGADPAVAVRMSYIESRFMYCYWMEQLLVKQEQWDELKRLVSAGFNVNIAGYDGQPVVRPLDELYEDPARPFGHELVIVAMLMIPERRQYPWWKYYRAHRELYAPLGIVGEPLADETAPAEPQK